MKRFISTYELCDGDINKLSLMLRKGVYPYEYLYRWKKFYETSLPKKEDFYSNLNIENITDADYKYEQKAWKNSDIKNLGEYHDLYV